MIRTEPERTRAQHRETMRELVQAELKEHVIHPDPERTRQWVCSRPGTGLYSFRVIETPGSLVILGQMGDLVFQPGAVGTGRMGGPIGWLRGAQGSPDYAFGKVPQNMRSKVFLPAEVDAQLELRIRGEVESGDADGERYLNNLKEGA